MEVRTRGTTRQILDDARAVRRPENAVQIRPIGNSRAGLDTLGLRQPDHEQEFSHRIRRKLNPLLKHRPVSHDETSIARTAVFDGGAGDRGNPGIGAVFSARVEQEVRDARELWRDKQPQEKDGGRVGDHAATSLFD